MIMIDVDTITLICFLDELAKRSRIGIYPFSIATSEQENGLLYDDERPIDEALYHTKYPLVAPYITDDEHYNIDGIEAIVHKEVNDVYVSVTSRNDPDFYIVIENGRWCKL